MRDPGNVILRRALRVALLVPVTYYVVQVLLGLTNASLASAFACFSMLALADLGGPRRERFFANAIQCAFRTFRAHLDDALDFQLVSHCSPNKKGRRIASTSLHHASH